jgi:hypothetical protein
MTPSQWDKDINKKYVFRKAIIPAPKGWNVWYASQMDMAGTKAKVVFFKKRSK